MRNTRDIATRAIISRHLAWIRAQLERGPFLAAFDAGLYDEAA